MDTNALSGKHRECPRVNRLFFIAYVNREGEEQKTPVSLGRTLNISKNGVGIEVFQQIAVGSSMEMEIDLEESLLSVQGRVVHEESYGNGSHYLGVVFNEPQERLAHLGNEISG